MIRTWKDIYSEDEWKSILETSLLPNAKPARSDARLIPLTYKIKNYHALNKRTLANFPRRISYLGDIRSQAETLAVDFVDQQEKKLVEKSARALRAKSGPAPIVKSTQFGPWLRSLIKRCDNKATYLNMLSTYYKQSQPDQSPFVYMSYLRRKLERQRTMTDGRYLTTGVRLEKLDPTHRQSEFDLDPDHFDPGLQPPKHFPLDEAFFEWLGDGKSNGGEPFFVWLEGHPICTASRGFQGWNDRYKSHVRSIPYSLHVECIDLSTNRLMSTPLGVHGGNLGSAKVPLNTKNLGISLKMPGGAAYVWSKTGEIYTHRHEPGVWHHSSFTAGQRVRCAGMWTVENGEVTEINCDSGHYKPTDADLLNFVKHLRVKSCLRDDVKVFRHRRSQKRKSLSDFLMNHNLDD